MSHSLIEAPLTALTDAVACDRYYGHVSLETSGNKYSTHVHSRGCSGIAYPGLGISGTCLKWHLPEVVSCRRLIFTWPFD